MAFYQKTLNHINDEDEVEDNEKTKPQGYSSTRVTHEKRLAVQNAFQQDCEILMKNYSDMSTFDFNIFCDLWTEQDFSLIYGGYYQTMQMGYYMQFLFNTAKKFVLFGTTRSMQAGGIFLLYGLYYKQPAEHTYKISIIQSEYEAMEKFVENMLRLRKLEVVYVFYKLVHSCAFEFTCTQYKLVLSAGLTKSDLTLNNNLYYKEDSMDIRKETKEEMNMIYKVDQDYQKLLHDYLNENAMTIHSYPLTLRETTDAIIDADTGDEVAVKSPELGEASTSHNIKKKAYQTSVGTWRDKLLKTTINLTDDSD